LISFFQPALTISVRTEAELAQALAKGCRGEIAVEPDGVP
jgi:hypothetical protein